VRLAALLACIAAAGCAPAIQPRDDIPAIAVAPAPDCRVERVATVQLEMVRGIWLVPVEIDGARLRLILDTGAERTLLTQAAVSRLAMLRDPAHETRTFGFGGLSTTEDARVTSFAVGGAYLPVASVTVGPFALPVFAGAPLDGLLGADVLSAFDVDLDARDGRLTLYRPRACPQAGPPWQEPYESIGQVTLARDRLLVPIRLDGVPGVATLDSGAQHTAVSQSLAARVGVGAAMLDRDPTIAAHGAAAEPLSVPVHRFRLLQIGPTELPDPVLPVVPMPGADMPEGLGDGLAGVDFMAGRRLWLSYASRRVFITRLAAPPAVPAPAG
jgi:predicted aspartyl protease